MQSMCTKKTVLVISGVVSVVLVLIDRIGTYQLCGGYPGLCVDTLVYSSMLLFVFPVALLFSLITYKMRDEVSRAWIKFTTWWVPLQILLVALTPESSGGYFVVILDTQFAAIILSGLFTIISLLLIVVKFFSLRK